MLEHDQKLIENFIDGDCTAFFGTQFERLVAFFSREKAKYLIGEASVEPNFQRAYLHVE